MRRPCGRQAEPRITTTWRAKPKARTKWWRMRMVACRAWSVVPTPSCPSSARFRPRNHRAHVTRPSVSTESFGSTRGCWASRRKASLRRLRPCANKRLAGPANILVATFAMRERGQSGTAQQRPQLRVDLPPRCARVEHGFGPARPMRIGDRGWTFSARIELHGQRRSLHLASGVDLPDVVQGYETRHARGNTILGQASQGREPAPQHGLGF